MACRGSGVRVPSDPPERRGSPAGRASSRFCVCVCPAAGAGRGPLEATRSGPLAGVRARNGSPRRGVAVVASRRAHGDAAFWGPGGGEGPERVISWWCGHELPGAARRPLPTPGASRDPGARRGAARVRRPRAGCVGVALIEVSRSGGWPVVRAQDGSPRRGGVVAAPAALIEVTRSGGWARVWAQDGSPRRGAATRGAARARVPVRPPGGCWGRAVHRLHAGT